MMHAKTEKYISFFGTVFAGLSVAAGAFGAHALKAHLDSSALMIFETAVRYQMYHSLALMFLPSVAHQYTINVQSVALSFLSGIVLFSGSLVGLSLMGNKWLGAITPLGGVAFLFGWFLLAIKIFKSQRS